MTIVEFLEARIAEDEAQAREYQQYEQEVYEAAGWFDCTRVLAECEAKRAILTYLTGLTADRGRGSETGAQFRSVRWVAEQMAAIYKDHPDYQQEWAG